MSGQIRYVPFCKRGIMNSNITTIIFDYGGVISLMQNITHVDAICDILNIDIQQYQSIYQLVREDYDAGIISAKDYWQKVASQIDVNKSISDSDLKEIIKHDVLGWSGINENTIGLIEILKKNKYKLAILSNMTFDTLQYLNNRSRWMDYFDIKVFSCEENVCKPHESIYLTTLKKLSADPMNTLFIDDSLINIEESIKQGINPIHYKNHQDLMTELQNKYEINIH